MSENYRQALIKSHIQADPFAKMLGAMVEDVQAGYSRATLLIHDHHLNFHGTTHGGVIFSLADIAFAAASNSRGQTAVALNVDISFLQAVTVGERIVAEAREISLNGPIGLYDITVKNQKTGDLIAQNQAMAYRKKQFFVEEAGDE